MSTAACPHLDTNEFTAIPDPVVGCQGCLKIGSPRVHLRMRMECGKVGCCDGSPNRHTSKHAREVSHPIIKSAELFSIARFENVIDAHLRGLADRGRRRSLEPVTSVASSSFPGIDKAVEGRPGT